MAFTTSSGVRAPAPKRRRRKKPKPIVSQEVARQQRAAPKRKPTPPRTPDRIPIPGPAGGDLEGTQPVRAGSGHLPTSWGVDRQPSPDSTEGWVRAYTDRYFAQNHAFPDAVVVAQMMNAKNAPTRPDQLDEVWNAQLEADEESANYMRAGDFFQMADDKAFDTLTEAVGIHPLGAARGPKSLTAPVNMNPATRQAIQVDQETIKAQTEYIRHLKARRFTSPDDFLGAVYEVNKVKWELARRLRNRGRSVPWEEEELGNGIYSPDFEAVIRKYIFGRQLVYALYGSPAEQAQANKIIESIRRTSYGKDKLAVMAQRLGIEAGQFDSNDTAMSILSAMKYADDDLVRQIAFDGWMFGRPIGQTPSDARRQYAELAGINRLPMAEMEAYHTENMGVNRVISMMSGAMEWTKEAVYDIPVLGDAAESVGRVMKTPAYWLNLPMEVLMGTCTKYLEIVNYADRGMYMEEWRREMELVGGEEKYEEKYGTRPFDWGALVDAKVWADAAERSGGRSPITEALQTITMEEDGKYHPEAQAFGQMADLALMLYVGAKVGDKFVDYSIGAGLKGTWKGARVAHKAGYNYYQSRPQFFGTGGRPGFTPGFIVIESARSLMGKRELELSGGVDTTQPPPVDGVGSVRPLNGGEGITVRVVPAKDDYVSSSMFAITSSRGAVGANAMPVTPKAVDAADEAARNDPASFRDEDVILRPLTYSEFRMYEPAIPGLTYHGGKWDYDPVGSRHRGFGEGAGLYVSDRIWMAAEYVGRWLFNKPARARTADPNGPPYPMETKYFEGTPNNPIDFDAPANEQFWREIVWDLFHKTDKGYHPRATDGKNPVRSAVADERFNQMLEDIGFHRAQTDKEWVRELTTHAPKGPMVKGQALSNQEMFMKLFEHMQKWFAQVHAHELDRDFLTPTNEVDSSLMKFLELTQEALWRRGYDAQTHIEGHLRSPHKVTVWWKQAIEGDFTDPTMKFKPDKNLKGKAGRLTVMARLRTLESSWPPDKVDDALNKWSDAMMANLKAKAQRGEPLTDWEEFFVENKGKFKENYYPQPVLEWVARQDALWDDWVHVGSEVKDGQLIHRMLDKSMGDEVMTLVPGKKQDVGHIKGALKSFYPEGQGPRMLNRQEAYQKYLDKFNDILEEHASAQHSPIQGKSHDPDIPDSPVPQAPGPKAAEPPVTPREPIPFDRTTFEDTQVTTFYDPATGRMLYFKAPNMAHLAVMKMLLEKYGHLPGVKEWVHSLYTITPNKYADVPELIIHATGANGKLLQGAPEMKHVQAIIGKMAKHNAMEYDMPVRTTRPGREGMPSEVADIVQPAFVYAKGNRSKADFMHIEDVVQYVKPTKGTVDTGSPGSVTIDFLTGGLIFKTTSTPRGTRTNVQPYAPPQWLQTNAEMMARIDDPFAIARVYGLLSTTNPKIKAIINEIADMKDTGKIGEKLRELETHGVNIDAGAYAGLQAAKIRAMESRIGTLGWARVFTTMTTYGKRQPLDGAVDNIYNVGRAIKLGDKKGKKETMQKLDQIARKAWRAENGNDVQNVVDEMWDIFRENLGPEEFAKFEDFVVKVRRAQGRSYIEAEHKTAYHGKVVGSAEGAARAAEASKVIPPDQRKLLNDQLEWAQKKYEERIDERIAELTKQRDAARAEFAAKHPNDPQKQGLAPGGRITELQRRIDRLKRDKKNAVSSGVRRQQNAVLRMADELGATPEEMAKVVDAVRDATERAAEFDRAANIFVTLGDIPRNKWTKKQKADWKWAEEKYDSYAKPQPFRMQQSRQNITHRYDPRLAGWYMSGKGVQRFMKFDQALAEPLMRTFKETVMASLAFPLRVNIGDEVVRLIPEGVLNRWVTAKVHPGKKTPKALIAQMKIDGHDFTPFMRKLHESLARDWDTKGNADDWTLLMPRAGDVGYVKALKTDLQVWRNEPIILALINHPRYGGKGKFPDRIPDIKAFIKRLRDQRTKDADGNTVLTDDAAKLRRFLDDTYRSSTQPGGLLYDTKMFDEWCEAWQDRLEVIAKHPELRAAMVRDVSTEDLNKLVSRAEEDLWPVNAPQRVKMDYSPSKGNPLYAIQPANFIFHPIYNRAVVPTLGAIGRWTKETIFADRYYTLRNEILTKHREVQAAALKRGEKIDDIDPAELHETCARQAMEHANKAGYNQSTTMFEDMARNMIPFVSAYRQFWLYWAKTTMKHPVSMAVFKENYPEFMQDPFGWHPGDVQFLIPQIPFWGPTEDGAESMWAQLKQQMPTAGFIPAVLGRTAISTLGGDPELFADLPFLGGLSDSYAPFRRQGQLLYGVTGTDVLSSTMPALFGSAEKLEKAHTNAVLTWLKYGPEPTGSEVNLDNAPIWAKVILGLADITTGGKWKPKPEALYNEFMKTFFPINAYYSPEHVHERQNMLADYQKLENAGDEAGMAAMRAKNKFLDTWLTYYDATPEEQIAMKLDPKNAELVKWWVSPYDYDEVGNFLEPGEWRNNLFAGGRSFKSDAELFAAVHNLYTNIYGGTYVQGKWVTAGTDYPGDIAFTKAKKGMETIIRKRLDWARGVSVQLEKQGFGSREQLMEQFKEPGPVQPDGSRLDWGIWNIIIKERGLKPYDYDIGFMKDRFARDFGAQLRVQPHEVGTNEFLKLVGLSHYVTKPELQRKMREATPYRKDVQQSRRELKQEVQSTVIGLASNQWYDITAEHLEIVLNRPVDKRINIVQAKLHGKYNEKFNLKPGSTEYREWRNDYYALQEKLLGKLKGGRALIGGLDDRLEHIPHFTTPDTVNIGAGPKADQQLFAWNKYKTERAAMIKSGKIDQERLDQLWKDFTGKEPGATGATPIARRAMEQGRVRYWNYILELAHTYRKKLKESYSDYYEAKGNSVETDIGKKYAKELNDVISNAAAQNPRFARDIEMYFSNSTNVGGHLIDWYAY